MTDMMIGRRHVLFGAASLSALLLAGCATTTARPARAVAAQAKAEPSYASVPPDVLSLYSARPEEAYPLPRARIELIDPVYWRQRVSNTTGEKPGTVVVDTANRFLYFTEEGGTAMRYGVGIGRDGFSWSGRARIAYKRVWPKWTPPSEMIDRQPELEKYRFGMDPGLDNPLGARALYIFQGGTDTLYRLHGNPDEKTIGRAVSSGCVRLLQQDVIDLYQRVPDGAPILVI